MRLFCALILMTVVLAGCAPEGPAERTGSRIDEIGDNLREGDPPLKERGPFERAGDSIDEALEEE